MKTSAHNLPIKVKALLLGAAALGTLMSQVNAVNEPVTRTVPPGFCLLANNFDQGDNSLNVVLPGVPVETQVLKFANNNYHVDIFDGTAWLDSLTGEPSRTTVSPGQGFFLFNPTSSNLVVTFSGIARQGVQTISFSPGFTMVGSPVPRPVSLNASNGFPQVLEMQIWRFDCATQRYWVNFCGFNQVCLDDTGEPVSIPAGEGFFVFNPGATPLYWIRDWSP